MRGPRLRQSLRRVAIGQPDQSRAVLCAVLFRAVWRTAGQEVDLGDEAAVGQRKGQRPKVGPARRAGRGTGGTSGTGQGAEDNRGAGRALEIFRNCRHLGPCWASTTIRVCVVRFVRSDASPGFIVTNTAKVLARSSSTPSKIKLACCRVAMRAGQHAGGGRHSAVSRCACDACLGVFGEENGLDLLGHHGQHLNRL